MEADSSVGKKVVFNGDFDASVMSLNKLNVIERSSTLYNDV